MLKNFRDSNDDVRLESAVDVLGCMHENGLNDFLPHFARRWKFWASFQPLTSCTLARSFSALRRLKTISQKHDGAFSIQQPVCHLHWACVCESFSSDDWQDLQRVCISASQGSCVCSLLRLRVSFWVILVWICNATFVMAIFKVWYFVFVHWAYLRNVHVFV